MKSNFQSFFSIKHFIDLPKNLHNSNKTPRRKESHFHFEISSRLAAFIGLLENDGARTEHPRIEAEDHLSGDCQRPLRVAGCDSACRDAHRRIAEEERQGQGAHH